MMELHHIMMLIHHKLYDSYKLYYCLILVKTVAGTGLPHTIPITYQYLGSLLAVQNSSIGDLVRLSVPWLGTTNNQSLHNITELPQRLVTFET